MYVKVSIVHSPIKYSNLSLSLLYNTLSSISLSLPHPTLLHSHFTHTLSLHSLHTYSHFTLTLSLHTHSLITHTLTLFTFVLLWSNTRSLNSLKSPNDSNKSNTSPQISSLTVSESVRLRENCLEVCVM